MDFDPFDDSGIVLFFGRFVVVAERHIFFFSCVFTQRKNPNETDPLHRKSGQVAQNFREVSITSRCSSIICCFLCRCCLRDEELEGFVCIFVKTKGPDLSFEEATPVGPSMDTSQLKIDDLKTSSVLRVYLF